MTCATPQLEIAMRRAARSSICATLVIGCVASTSCSLTQTYGKCGFSGCAGDAEITAAVRARLATKTGSIDVSVQTLDHVVYLYGIVDTDLDRVTMVDAARAVPGVVRVVESIGVRNGVY